MKSLGNCVCAIAPIAALLASCVPSEQDSDHVQAFIDTNGKAGFSVRIPELGYDFKAIDAYQAGIGDVQTQAERQSRPLEFVAEGAVEEEMSSLYGVGSSGESFDEAPQARPEWETRKGIFVITGGCSSGGHVPGKCMGRPMPHCNLRINTTDGRQLYDLHVGDWINEDGERCMGFYQSVKPLTYDECFCFPSDHDIWESYGQVRDKLMQGFVAAGFGVATAAFLAEVTTPITIGGLVAL